MKRNLIQGTLLLLFALIVCTSAAVAAEDTVTRDLPPTADAGTAIAVNLTIDVESGATFYAIDETVPSGWTVTSATGGGNYTSEAGHVKWVVTSGAADTVYSYTVLVPADASGTYTFDDIYAFEGMTAEATILGDTDVDVAGGSVPFAVGGHVYLDTATVSGADVTVTNLNTSESLTTTTDGDGAYVVNLGNLPSGHNAGNIIQVTATYNGHTGTNSAPRSENLSDSPQIIDVTIAQAVQIKAEDGGSLPDNIPVGETFTVLITEDGSPVGAGTIVIFTLPHDTGDPVTVSTDDSGKVNYMPLITGTLGIRVLNGTVTVAEATVNVVTVAEDTVTRDLPSTTGAGAAIAVNLTVDVESGVTFYAIDETVPTGWTVTSATSGGDYTAEAGHVKWVVTSGADDTVYSYTVLVPADASGTYTFDGIYAFEGMTAEATILGDTDVDVSVSPPTLVTYTITNTTIIPPQTTSIDVRFSERVSAIIKIEDASGNLVNELYTSTGVTDPTPKTWDGTYTNGTQVSDGTYTVNVSGVSTTTGLSVVNTSKTITVGVTHTTVSIGSAEGSVGDTVNVSINITNASMIGAMDIRVTYDASILTATGVANGTIVEGMSDLLWAHDISAGRVNISFATCPETVNGDGELFVVTFAADAAGNSALNITVTEAWTGEVPAQPVPVDTVDGVFTVVGEVEVTTVSIGSATGANDSTVTVQISLANAENITGASPTITYDPSVVQVQSMTANTSGAMTLQAVNIDNTAGKAIMSLTALSPGIAVTDPTPIADVTFHLVGGDDTSTDLEFVDTADMLSDKDFNSFAPTTLENGSIVISMKGDFNGNGKIDIGDVAKIANLQVGNIPTTPGDLVKGDFNGNGKIDIGDVAKLANYQVGNIDEL